MKKRIGYGRLADTPKQPKVRVIRDPRLRNQLNKGFASFVRDSEGNCFKAVIAGESFTWVEIEAAEFEAANDSRA